MIQPKLVKYGTNCFGLVVDAFYHILKPRYDNTNAQDLLISKTGKYLVTPDLNRYFFVYLGFLSQTFTIHRTAREGGGYLFNSSLPLPPASQTHRH